MNGKLTALVTGASSGIGLELAKLFAHDNHDLVLVARNSEALAAVADEFRKNNNVKVVCLAKDLSSPSAPDELYKSIKNENLEIDVLVNNAGFGWYGDFAKMDNYLFLEMIQVNVSALTHLTRLFLTDMLLKNKGRILNVASTAAFQPGPLMSVYYASKAYVLNFSLALAEELRNTGITVTALCPGPTPTNFGKRAGFKKNMKLSGILSTDVAAVANAGYRGLFKGKDIVIPGKMNWIGTQFIRLLPRTLPAKLIKQAQLQRGD